MSVLFSREIIGVSSLFAEKRIDTNNSLGSVSYIKLKHAVLGKRAAPVIERSFCAGCSTEVRTEDDSLDQLAGHYHGNVLAQAAVHAVAEMEAAVIRPARLKLVGGQGELVRVEHGRPSQGENDRARGDRLLSGLVPLATV